VVVFVYVCMGLIARLAFWRDNSTGEMPPKPDTETGETKREFDVFETTIHYRNGDTETFKSYGIEGRGADLIEFSVPEVHASGKRLYTRTRREMYEVLEREPTLKKVGTETWVNEWSKDWRERERYRRQNEWVSTYTSDNLEKVEDTTE